MRQGIRTDRGDNSKSQSPIDGSGAGGNALEALLDTHRAVVLRLDSVVCAISRDAVAGRTSARQWKGGDILKPFGRKGSRGLTHLRMSTI